MNTLRMILVFLLITSLSYAMNREQSMGAITIQNITEDKSVIIPADLIPFTTISQFQGGVITSPLSSQFFQLLKDLLYANKTMTCLQKNDLKCTKNIITLLENNQYNLPDDFASWFELAYLIEVLHCSSATYDGFAFYFAHFIKDKTNEVITVLENFPEARKLSAQGFFHRVAIFYDLCFDKKITTHTIEGYSIQELLLCDLIKIYKRHSRSHNYTKHKLDLSGLRINSLDGFDNIPGIERITHLMLSNNTIKTLPKNFLLPCKFLHYIDLSGNQISALPESFLSTAYELLFLDLGGNKLSLLPNNFLSSCKRLQLLYLNNNDLHALPDNFLSQATKIKRLNLSNNHITLLPTNFLHNNKYINPYVSLDSNLITNLDTLPQQIQERIRNRKRKRSHNELEIDQDTPQEPAAKRQRQ